MDFIQEDLKLWLKRFNLGWGWVSFVLLDQAVRVKISDFSQALL